MQHVDIELIFQILFVKSSIIENFPNYQVTQWALFLSQGYVC
jgi:hypothetical protein